VLTGPVDERDREDLLGVLTLRFGPIGAETRARVAALTDPGAIDHLILAAANAARWEHFLEELKRPGFRVVGPHFDPLRDAVGSKGRSE
jgi:hypothetical protein